MESGAGSEKPLEGVDTGRKSMSSRQQRESATKMKRKGYETSEEVSEKTEVETRLNEEECLQVKQALAIAASLGKQLYEPSADRGADALAGAKAADGIHNWRGA